MLFGINNYAIFVFAGLYIIFTLLNIFMKKHNEYYAFGAVSAVALYVASVLRNGVNYFNAKDYAAFNDVIVTMNSKMFYLIAIIIGINFGALIARNKHKS